MGACEAAGGAEVARPCRDGRLHNRTATRAFSGPERDAKTG